MYCVEHFRKLAKFDFFISPRPREAACDWKSPSLAEGRCKVSFELGEQDGRPWAMRIRNPDGSQFNISWILRIADKNSGAVLFPSIVGVSK